MTKHLFDVSVTSVQAIHDMPGAWSDDDYRRLLTQLEVDGVDDVCGSDLLDMTAMALQDLEADDAADAVLAYKLGESISAGARGNIIEDLLDDQRPWEEAADITLHAPIFAAAILLHKVFPASYAKPDMMRAILQIRAAMPEADGIIWRAEFDDQSLAENPSARLTVYSSAHWLKALEPISDFQSNAYNDTDPRESNHGRL